MSGAGNSLRSRAESLALALRDAPVEPDELFGCVRDILYATRARMISYGPITRESIGRSSGPYHEAGLLLTEALRRLRDDVLYCLPASERRAGGQ